MQLYLFFLSLILPCNSKIKSWKISNFTVRNAVRSMSLVKFYFFLWIRFCHTYGVSVVAFHTLHIFCPFSLSSLLHQVTWISNILHNYIFFFSFKFNFILLPTLVGKKLGNYSRHFYSMSDASSLSIVYFVNLGGFYWLTNRIRCIWLCSFCMGRIR
jgi:hypothetical protein